MGGSAKLCICGEGANELGRWIGAAGRPTSDEIPRNPGVIGAVIERLLGRPVAPDEVALVLVWKKISKLGERRRRERGCNVDRDQRNVRALALHALQRGCNAIVFLRDADGSAKRRRGVEAGIHDVLNAWPGLTIAGGIPTRNLEAWILALRGVHGTESMGLQRLEKELARQKIEPKNTQHYVDTVRSSDFTAIPPDACRLQDWLQALEPVAALLQR